MCRAFLIFKSMSIYVIFILKNLKISFMPLVISLKILKNLSFENYLWFIIINNKQERTRT